MKDADVYKDEAVRLVWDDCFLHALISTFIDLSGAAMSLQSSNENVLFFGKQDPAGSLLAQSISCVSIQGMAFYDNPDFRSDRTDTDDLLRLLKKLKRFGDEVLEAASKDVWIAGHRVKFRFLVPLQSVEGLMTCR